MARRRKSCNSSNGGCLGVFIILGLVLCLIPQYWYTILLITAIAFLIWLLSNTVKNQSSANNNNIPASNTSTQVSNQRFDSLDKYHAIGSASSTTSAQNNFNASTSVVSTYSGNEPNICHEINRQIAEILNHRKELIDRIDKTQKSIWKLNKSIGELGQEKTQRRDALVEQKELLDGRLNAAVYTFRESESKSFTELKSAFSSLKESNARTYDATPSCKALVTAYIPVGDMKYILFTSEPLCLSLGGDLFCISPSYIVRFKKDGTYVTTYTCRALNARIENTTYTEQVTKYRWLYAKQDGGRDMRYSNNRQISYQTTQTHTVPNMLYLVLAEITIKYDVEYGVRNRVAAAIKVYTAVEPSKTYDAVYHLTRLLSTCDPNNPNLLKLQRMINGDDNYIEYIDDVPETSASTLYSSARNEHIQYNEGPKNKKKKRALKRIILVIILGLAIFEAAKYGPEMIDKIMNNHTSNGAFRNPDTLATLAPSNGLVSTENNANLGNHTEQSNEIEPDQVDPGNRDAYELITLGNKYYSGNHVKKSYEKALEYFKLAAEQGNVTALFNVGYMYEHGEGVKQSFEMALEYYQLAANKGYGHALNNLGNMYENGQGVEQSYEKAFECYQAAVDKGIAEAYINIGSLYKNGQGVKQSYEKAIECFETAISKGVMDAHLNLGSMYYNGEGVDQSYEKAFENFLVAGYYDNSRALYIVGLLYKDGIGTEQSYEKAREYLQRAADLGFEKAINELEIMDRTSQSDAPNDVSMVDSIQAPTESLTTQPTPEPTPIIVDANLLDGVCGFSFSVGNRGDATRFIQQMLIDQSYLSAGQADGVYGSKTEMAVKRFQEANGIESTGIVDLATQFKLAELESGFKQVEGQTYEYAGLDRYGVYRFDDGVFIGVLKKDQSYQEGTLYYEDGSIYAGPFKNNQRNGKGEAWFPNGDYYIGNWKDDQMSGKGVYHFGSVDSVEQYDGEWVNGQMSGKGTYTMADGTTIKAIWENNQQVGWWK